LYLSADITYLGFVPKFRTFFTDKYSSLPLLLLYVRTIFRQWLDKKKPLGLKYSLADVIYSLAPKILVHNFEENKCHLE
jgi:hypothetical protein